MHLRIDHSEKAPKGGKRERERGKGKEGKKT